MKTERGWLMNSDERAAQFIKEQNFQDDTDGDFLADFQAALVALLTDWERDLKRGFLVMLNNALYAEDYKQTDEVIEAAIAEFSRPAGKETP